MKQSAVIDSAYRIAGDAREGGMAKIYRAIRIRDNKFVVLKILKEEFRSAPDALGRLNHEEEIGLLLNHKNIVQYIDDFRYKMEWYIVLEYCGKGDMEQFKKKVGKIPEQHCKLFVRGIL